MQMQMIRIKIGETKQVSLIFQIMKKLKPKSLFLTFAVLFQAALAPAIADSKIENRRIISAGGSITEIMFALGLGEQLVAVDTSSFFPKQAVALPKVGYFRSLGAEGLMSLNPDMLVVAKGAGPKAVLDQVKDLGVEVKTYDQSTYTIDSWRQLIREVGQDFDKPHAASELVDTVVANIGKRQAERKFEGRGLNAIALLSIGQRGPVAAGRNTVPNLLFELSGINNVANKLEGYKPFSSELLAEQKLDLVVVPSHVVDGLGGENAVCESELIRMATTNQCHLYVMDGLLLMGFGARLDQAVGEVISVANDSSPSRRK